jgi:hypothetical protein
VYNNPVNHMLSTTVRFVIANPNLQQMLFHGCATCQLPAAAAKCCICIMYVMNHLPHLKQSAELVALHHPYCTLHVSYSARMLHLLSPCAGHPCALQGAG